MIQRMIPHLKQTPATLACGNDGYIKKDGMFSFS